MKRDLSWVALAFVAAAGCNHGSAGSAGRRSAGDAGTSASTAATSHASARSTGSSVFLERDKRCFVTTPGDWESSPSEQWKELRLRRRDDAMYIAMDTTAKEDVHDKDLATYAARRRKALIAGLEDGKALATTTRTTSKGYAEIETEIEGSQTSYNYVYLQMVVESPDYYHYLIGWSLKSKRVEAAPVLRRIADSLEMTDSGTERDGG
jgi:hypothetical protein